MLIFIVVMLLTAAYLLWSERHSHFLVFSFETNPKISTLFIVTAVVLIVISFLGLFILFTLSKYFNFITLILGTIAIFVFSVVFMRFYE